MPRPKKVPAYCRCHRSGKAYILQRGDDERLHRYYIGQWGSRQSLELYEETIMVNLNVPELDAAMRKARAKVRAVQAREQTR